MVSRPATQCQARGHKQSSEHCRCHTQFVKCSRSLIYSVTLISIRCYRCQMPCCKGLCRLTGRHTSSSSTSHLQGSARHPSTGLGLVVALLSSAYLFAVLASAASAAKGPVHCTVSCPQLAVAACVGLSRLHKSAHSPHQSECRHVLCPPNHGWSWWDRLRPAQQQQPVSRAPSARQQDRRHATHRSPAVLQVRWR